MSAFMGLETALRALLAERRALDTISHNVANASRKGYSRQVAQLEATPAYPSGSPSTLAGEIGTGVDVARIVRMRDGFLDLQAREAIAAQGQSSTEAQVLSQVETLVNEPTDTGLRATLDAYWQSWQALANNPESTAARQNVLQRAAAVVDALHYLSNQLSAVRDNVSRTIADTADQVSSLTARIAGLNQTIGNAVAQKQAPNDLLDQRDQALDQLAKLLPVQVIAQDNGMVRVTTGGVTLVDGADHERLTMAAGGSLTWQNANVPALVTGGRLAGLVRLRDVTLSDYTNRLDLWARDFAGMSNAQHQAGYDLNGNPGQALFVGSSAATLAVNPAVAADPRLLAAASQASGVPGDGTNALAMAGVQQQATASGTLDERYRAWVGEIGADSAEAQRQTDNANNLVQAIDQQRASVSGVSLDEEMTRMIQYQHAYEAAAKVMNTMNSLLDTLINRVGQ